MTAPERINLPRRRMLVTVDVLVGPTNAAVPMTVSVGFLPNRDTPVEVWLNGGKEGSAFDAMASHAAITQSILLQYGFDVSVLAHSINYEPEDRNQHPAVYASPLAAAIDVLLQIKGGNHGLKARSLLQA